MKFTASFRDLLLEIVNNVVKDIIDRDKTVTPLETLQKKILDNL